MSPKDENLLAAFRMLESSIVSEDAKLVARAVLAMSANIHELRCAIELLTRQLNVDLGDIAEAIDEK